MSNYELSGTVNALISAAVSCTINGKHYEAGDPISYLKNVKGQIYFSRSVKSASNNDGILAGTYSGTPQTLMLYGVKLKESIMNLISVKDTSKEHLFPQFRQIESDANGVIALPTSYGKNIKNLKIFDKNIEKIQENSYKIDYANLLITKLNPNEIYRVFYYEVKEPLYSYFLSNNNVPNLKIELITTGQQVSEEKDRPLTGVYTIYNAKLITSPDKDLSIDSIDGINLEFLIINNGVNTKPVRLEYYGE